MEIPKPNWLNRQKVEKCAAGIEVDVQVNPDDPAHFGLDQRGEVQKCRNNRLGTPAFLSIQIKWLSSPLTQNQANREVVVGCNTPICPDHTSQQKKEKK